MRKSSFYFGLLCCLIYSLNTAVAHFITPKDALFTIQMNQTIHVNAQGQSKTTNQYHIQLLKDRARGIFQKYAISYKTGNPVHVKEAYTLYKGIKYPVKPEAMTDKSLETDNSGFDSKRQVSIPFPKLRIGSTLYIEYDDFDTQIPFKKTYSNSFFLGTGGGYWTAYHLKLNSALTLYGFAHDPQHLLKISPLKRQGFHHLSITLKKPTTLATINENDRWPLNPKLITWISISNKTSWPPLVHKIAPSYEKILAGPLPQFYQKVVHQAKKQKSIIDQTNLITATLQNNIQYLGSWRTIKGSFIPRPLATIAHSGYGDCKEYAVLTVKMLRMLGYQAHVALVFRGYNYQSPYLLPGLNQFNHAIVHVVTPNGQVLWIDPTNNVSGAGLIFRDIENRMSLVLNDKKPSYEKIPPVKPQDAISTYEVHKKIRHNQLQHNLQAHFKDLSAQFYTGAGLTLSKQQIENSLYSQWSDYVQPKNRLKSKIPPLDSRIIKPITIKLSYIEHNPFMMTNLGQAILLPSPIRWSEIPDDSVRDCPVHAGILKIKTAFDALSFKSIDKINAHIHSPWIDWTRSCTDHHGNTIVKDTVVYKQNITREDRQTKTYLQFKNKLRQYRKNTALILPTHQSWMPIFGL